MTRARARLLALAAAILFSTGGAGIKVAAFSGPQVAMLRSVVAAVVLGIWLRGRLRPSWPAVWLGVVYACMLVLFVNATKMTTAAHAIFLQSMAPLYVLVLAPALLGESFRRRDVGWLALAGVGLALCVAGRPTASALAPDPTTGNLLALVCGVMWALTLVGLRRLQREGTGGEVGLVAVVFGNIFASVISLPFAWPVPSASAGDWATLVYLGTCQIGVAYVCLASAMRLLPALDASLLLLLEPVLNPVWAWLLRGESPGGWALAGGALIVGVTAGKSLYDARGLRMPRVAGIMPPAP